MTDSGNLQEVEGLWFPADLVILQAGSRIFRVFTSILKEKSPVFADMFAVPQPPSVDREAIDGVPVVRMHDDPEELEVFLRAIFDASYFASPPAPNEIEIAIGILRLAHKYDVPFLRRRALEHLGTQYCTRLEDYDKILTKSPYGMRTILKTIHVAVEVGALWLLPDAYYSLGDFSIKTVIASGAVWDCLGETEKNNCLDVFSHDTHMQFTHDALSFLTLPTNDACLDPAECDQVRFRAIRSLHMESGDALDSWDWNGYLTDSGFCEFCLEDAKEQHTHNRQALWDRLPQKFDLPDWNQLEAMRQTALA